MGSAILLLHGFTHTGASWDAVIGAAGAGAGPILAPDLRGHGSAAGVQPVTLEAVIGDLAALAPERFALAGYSMGGRIALHVALELADRVDRLVLIGASPGIADQRLRAARRASDETLAVELESSSIAEFADRWASAPLLAGQPAKVAASARADRLRNTPTGLARVLRGLGTGALPSLWERLGELRMPVVLVVGERDGRFRDQADQMARAIREAKIVVVPGAGHAVHLEAPDLVAGVIAGEGDLGPTEEAGRAAPAS